MFFWQALIVIGFAAARMSTCLQRLTCNKGFVAKPFSQAGLFEQEALRLLGLLGTPACACQAQVLQPPLLNRILSYFRLRLKARAPFHTAMPCFDMSKPG